MSDSGPVMRLPPAMRTALDEYAPGFRVWRLQEYDQRVHEKARAPRNLPLFAASSDMNGDGITDVALIGQTATHELLFVLLSEGNRHRAVEIRRSELPPANERTAQVRYLEPPPRGRTGFIESIEGVAGVLYVWQNGAFVEEVMGE